MVALFLNIRCTALKSPRTFFRLHKCIRPIRSFVFSTKTIRHCYLLKTCVFRQTFFYQLVFDMCDLIKQTENCLTLLSTFSFCHPTVNGQALHGEIFKTLGEERKIISVIDKGDENQRDSFCSSFWKLNTLEFACSFILGGKL